MHDHSCHGLVEHSQVCMHLPDLISAFPSCFQSLLINTCTVPHGTSLFLVGEGELTKLHYVAEKGIPDLQAGFVVSAEEHKVVQYLRSAGDYEQERRIEFQYCTAYGRPRNLEEISHHYEPRVGLNSLILWYEGIGEA